MLKAHPASEFLEPLVAASEQPGGFAEAARRLDWSVATPADYMAAVRLALEIGEHLTARELAGRGGEAFPEVTEIARAARILAQPTAVATGERIDSSARIDRTWLETHRDAYLGRWVSLRADELLASAPTARDLRRRVEPARDVLITRVI